MAIPALVNTAKSGNGFFFLLSPMTFLVFFTAVAWAFLVSSYLATPITKHKLSLLTGRARTCRGVLGMPIRSIRHYFLLLGNTTPNGMPIPMLTMVLLHLEGSLTSI